MKKSLIALAVLASSGAVMAQSSVTLYGLVDAYVGHKNTTTNTYVGNVLTTSVKTSQNVIDTAGANNSRWGLRGSEDLGGGLKANFVLENGFKTDDGTAAGVQFNRQSFVGLSGDFGSVSLGNQYTAYFALRTATNNQYDTNMATTDTVWKNGVADYAPRATSSIAYASPVFNGFSGAVALGLGENKATGLEPAGLKATKNYSAHVKYANGPLLVGYAYQVENARTAAGTALAANTGDQTYNLLAASYDLGVAKLTGGFNMAKQGASKDKEFQVGVSAPFGAAAVSAGYSYSKNEVSSVTGNKAHGLSLLGTYSLSKRTTVYAGLAATNVKTPTATLSKTSTAAVGVRHSF
jgi:predicted porin